MNRGSSGIGRGARASASARFCSQPVSARSIRSMTQAHLNRDGRVREALYRTRILVNRTPHFSPQTRREANRAIDILEGQLGLNHVNAADAAREIDFLSRAHSSLTFGLLRNEDFADRFRSEERSVGKECRCR